MSGPTMGGQIRIPEYGGSAGVRTNYLVMAAAAHNSAGCQQKSDKSTAPCAPFMFASLQIMF